MSDRDKDEPIESPGEGESVEDASRDAVRELEKRGRDGHAGAGDIG